MNCFFSINSFLLNRDAEMNRRNLNIQNRINKLRNAIIRIRYIQADKETMR